MSYKHFSMSIVTLLFAGLFTVNVNAAGVGPGHDFVFDFTGECDDCAFSGSPLDDNFNPIGDQLTQTVTGTLSLRNMFLNDEGLIEAVLEVDPIMIFAYNGSSLINPFTVRAGRGSFSTSLTPTGSVAPDNPLVFISRAFPGFDIPSCTEIGIQVLGDECSNLGSVAFLLNSSGDFSISSSVPFLLDIGFDGELTTAMNPVPVPAAAWLFGSALLGFFGYSRRKTKLLS